MINLFQLASNDQSLYYLGMIFGRVGGVLPVSNGPMLLSVMFKVLNTAALSVGAMIVIYTTIAGLLSTASEGEFLGKKWSGLWVPVRTVLGIVGLFPSTGGYCAIQVLIMWLIMQGIGLGDAVWTSALNLVQATGSPYATVPLPPVSAMATSQLKNLFIGLVCYETVATKVTDSALPKDIYFCQTQSNPDSEGSRCGKAVPPFDSSKTSYDLNGCGKITYCDVSAACGTSSPAAGNSSRAQQDSLGCMLCKAQHQALPGIISALDAVAKKFAQIDYEYQDFYLNSDGNTAPNKKPEWIRNFCSNKEGLADKCCVGLAAAMAAAESGQTPKSTTSSTSATSATSDPCSFTYFQRYRLGNSPNDGSANSNTVKDVYAEEIKSYTEGINFVTAAASQYQAVLNGAYMSYLATIPASARRDSWNAEAQRNGWILAGMYYMDITQRNKSTQVNLDNLPILTVTRPDSTNKEVSVGRNNIQAMTPLFDAINGASSDSSSGAAQVNEISAAAVGTASGMLTSFMNDIVGRNSTTPGVTQNPLYQISAYGYHMMIVVQAMYTVTLIATTIATALVSINVTALGTGFTTSPIFEGFKAAWSFLSPFLFLGMSALFSIGVLFGIYLPLIPYIIFLMGAVGWLMACIEAMVAGPIIALGILSPSGQHELLGKSEPAVLILFNLILRPGLMVFGMMASMLLAVVAVTMLNQGFAKIAFDIIAAPGLVEGIMFMVAYTSLLMMVLNKVFSLIHVIPEKVLTYIGGQAISYGESEGLAGMKQGMEGAASGMGGAGKESGGAAVAGVKATKEAKGSKPLPTGTATATPGVPVAQPPDNKGGGPDVDG